MSSRRTMNSGMAAGAIAVLSLVVGSVGVATAANGGSLLLGHKNSATKTTTLKDHKGTPLKLVGSKSKPPLKVNSSKQVKHLNASQVGGLSASDLMTAGDGFSTAVGVTLSTDQASATRVVHTGTLQPGVYFVQAVAEIDTDGNSTGARCYIGINNDTDGTAQTNFGAVASGTGNAVESRVLLVASPETVGEFCYTHDTSASTFNGTITAIAVPAFTVGGPALRRSSPAVHSAGAGG